MTQAKLGAGRIEEMTMGKRKQTSDPDRTVLLIGCGDVIRKARPTLEHMKKSGYQVIATDFKDDPVGRSDALIDKFYNLLDEAAYRDLH